MIRRRPAVLANEIRLRRSQHKGAFLVVEGRDDRLFMERFTCPDECKIIVVQGKENVLDVIEILEDDEFVGALGLIDSDFDRIEEIRHPSINIVTPEFHDLETMMLCSPALDRVLIEFGNKTKLENVQKNTLNELIERALPVAYLRLYSVREQLCLKFSRLRYSTWINPSSFCRRYS